MTPDAVQTAVRQLEANGEKVTARRVRKLLGGGSFRDLLPLLQNQSHSPDDQPTDPNYHRLIELAERLEQAVVEDSRQALGELIANAETRRAGCMMALLAAGTRSEPMDAWCEAYQRLQAAIATARGRLAAWTSTSRGAHGWMR